MVLNMKPRHPVVQIVHDHGWTALYRGNLLNVVRAVPQKALDFFSFEMYKVGPLVPIIFSPLSKLIFVRIVRNITEGHSTLRLLKMESTCQSATVYNRRYTPGKRQGMLQGWLGADKREGMGLTFVAAGMAGATSTVLLHPLEVLRSQLTVGMSTPGRHRSLLATTSHMLRQEGVGSLYKGLLPSVMAIIPEAAITYGAPRPSHNSRTLLVS